jgi:hypothetical protein
LRPLVPWLLAALALLAAQRVDGASAAGYPDLPLPAITCAVETGDNGTPQVVGPNVLLAVADDRSGSTWSTDIIEHPRREAELRAVVRHLARSRCRPDDLVAAESFEDVVPPAGPGAAKSKSDIDMVVAAIPDASKDTESGSVLAPSVERAAAWAGGHADHRAVLVVATDGLVDTESAEAIRRFPGRVIVLALAPLPDWWRDLPVRVVPLDRNRLQLGDVAVNLVHVLNDILKEEPA